jgi:hypothetical protein
MKFHPWAENGLWRGAVINILTNIHFRKFDYYHKYGWRFNILW